MDGIPLMRLVSFVLFMVGTLSMLAAFMSAFWFERRDQVYNILVHHGLWILCDYWFETEDKCIKIAGSHYNQRTGRLRVVQGFMCIAVILAAVTLPLYIVWMCQGQKQLGTVKAKRIGRTALSFCMLTGLFNFMGILVFGAHYSKYEEVLSWSYMLAVAGGGFNTLNGLICLICAQCCINDSPDEMPRNTYPEQTRALPSIPVPLGESRPMTSRSMSTEDEIMYLDQRDRSYGMNNEQVGFNGSSLDSQEFHQNSVV